ncbi:MAG: hypothetical protein ACYC1M_16465 [Armatimonadota bacterium]
MVYIPKPTSRSRRRPSLWMAHHQPNQLTDQPDGWPDTAKQLDCLEFYITIIAFVMPYEDIKRVVDRVHELGMEIAVECGYFDWEPIFKEPKGPKPVLQGDKPRLVMYKGVGASTAQTEMLKMDKLFQAGGVPSYLNMDGPIRRLMHPGQDASRDDIPGMTDINLVADEIVGYMKEWRKLFPKMKFFELTNFPNWGWRGNTSYRGDGMCNGDLAELLPVVLDAARKAGVPFAGVTADNPYEYAKGTANHSVWMHYKNDPPRGEKDPTKINWMARILELERMVKARHIDFSLIVNSEGGNISSEAFCKGTLNMVDEYRKIGGRPSRYIVQSWLKYPEKVVPESEMYTLAWLLEQVVRRVRR